MRIKWENTIRLVLDPSQIFGTNAAYGHTIRGSGNRRFAQRFLLPGAKEYKEKWTRFFQLVDTPTPVIRKFHDLEEGKKPLLALRFDWVYRTEDFTFKTGRLKGFDCSNLFKLVEDALSEYMGVDDSRVVYLIGTKRPTDKFLTQCTLRIGYVDGSITIEEDPEAFEGFNMTDELIAAKLPSITPYVYLVSSKKYAVEDVIDEHACSDDIAGAIKVALLEFGGDAHIILSMIEMMTTNGVVKPGLWDGLVKIMEGPTDCVPIGSGKRPVRETRHKKKRQKKNPDAPPMRTPTLPFTNLRLKSDPATVALKWVVMNERKKRYTEDMLNWTTGEINWAAPKVYEMKDGCNERFVYRALLNTPRTYDELVAALKDTLPQAKVNIGLRKLMTDPSKLPPGAGTYCEQDGKMFIHRDLQEALKLSVGFKL